MLRVPITYAKPGMVLALPIRSPRRPEHLLLQAGYAMEDGAITRLREIGVTELWIRYPNLEFIGKYINPAILDGQARVGQAIGSAFDAVAASAHARLDYPAYKSTIHEFLDRLIEDPQAALFIEEIADRDDTMLRHSSNVCFLSMLMGLKLDGYLVAERRRLPAHRARNVESLGVGAMLHDIGMLRLAPEVRDRWERERDEADREWRKHVVIGFELVRGHVEPSAAAAVLHHHQRFDGTGFPIRPDEKGELVGLSGNKIHIFARIIAAADIFDRLRHPPAAAKPTPIVRALRAMLDNEIAGRLDPMTLKALLAVAPPYPPGSLVTLNNGVQGVVTDWSPEDPCRPVVQGVGNILQDYAREWVGPPRIFDLRRQKHLSVQIAEGEDVLDANFYPAHPGDFAIDSSLGCVGAA